MSYPQATIVTNTSALHENVDDEHAIQMQIISRLNNLGVGCIHSGEHEQAGQYFRRALDKASETAFFAIPHVQPSFTKCGEVSKSLYIYQRGEYDEGMHTYSEPVLLDAAYTSMHTATATVLFNLGQLYLRLNDHDEASSSFLRALQIAQWNNGGPSNSKKRQGVSVMAILHNIGHVQYRSGGYEDAVRTYAKALQLGKSSLGKDSHKMLEVAGKY